MESAGQRDRTATRSGGNRRRISLRRVDSVILYHNRRALAGDNSPARQTSAHLPRSTADRRSHSGGRAGGPGSRGGEASLPVRVTVVGGPDGPRWRSAAVVKAPLTATTVRLTEATPTDADRGLAVHLAAAAASRRRQVCLAGVAVAWCGITGPVSW